MPVDDAVNLEFNLVADFMAQQRLGHGRKVADEVLLRVGIPRAQDGEPLRLAAFARSVAWTMVPMLATSVRGLEKSVPRARTSCAFELRLAAHEEFLHFLGGLVFVVFAQVAVAAGDGDFPGVGRDLLLHQLVVLVLAPFQAVPGDQQIGFLPGLLAGDERLDGRDSS